MKISIVIPTYNRAGFIGKTIESLLSQQYQNYEIIVVDDGSTDNTSEVISSIGDDRVQYFKKVNGERGAARNFGAAKATGEYINFFDSDDVAYPNHLHQAYQSINQLNYPEVFELGYDVKDPDGNLIALVNNLPKQVNERLIDGNHLSCNGVFIRKDVFAKNPFDENRVLAASEDYQLWLRLASRFPFHFVNVVTSTVVNHEARSVLKINLEKFLARIDYLQRSLQEDRQFMLVYGSRLGIFKSYLHIYVSLHLSMAGMKHRERYQSLVKAVKLNPRVVATRRFLAAVKNIIL